MMWLSTLTQCGIHRSPSSTPCSLRPSEVLPFPGGPKRNRLRPDEAAKEATSTTSAGSTSGASAAWTLSTVGRGCLDICHSSIAAYDSSATGAGPTYPEISSSRRA